MPNQETSLCTGLWYLHGKEERKFVKEVEVSGLSYSQAGPGSLELPLHVLWEAEPCDSEKSVAFLLCSAYPRKQQTCWWSRMGSGLLLPHALAKENELGSFYARTKHLAQKTGGKNAVVSYSSMFIKCTHTCSNMWPMNWFFSERLLSLPFETKIINLTEIAFYSWDPKSSIRSLGPCLFYCPWS